MMSIYTMVINWDRGDSKSTKVINWDKDYLRSIVAASD